VTKKDLSHFYAFAAFLDAYKKEVFRLTDWIHPLTFELLTNKSKGKAYSAFHKARE